VYFFRNAAKKREAYLELFFGLDENVLKLLTSNCEKLLLKLKKSDIKIYDEKLENIDDGSEDKKLFKKKEKETPKRAINRKESAIKIKINLPTDIIGFIRYFALFLFITFLYYIFNAVFFISIGQKAILISQFFYKTQKIHSYMIDVFIAYRQYIFDETRVIYNMKTFDFLTAIEKESYESLSEEIFYIRDFIKKFFSKEKELIKRLNMSYCSYNYTDKFISIEDCKNKFGTILKFDFIYIITSFIEEIRINKFLVKYLLSTRTVRGNLSDNNQNIWLNDNTIPKKGYENNGNNIFRLDLFNNDTIHAYLDLVFVNIILPYIDIYRKYLFPFLSIDGEELHLYLSSAFYLVFVLIIYILYLYIKIRTINKQIYKTKNMLSLIPINTLASHNIAKSLIN
jgi:hypothetical protein